MELRFTRNARKHGIGKARAIEVINKSEFFPFVTAQGKNGLMFVGTDSTGLELEVGVAIESAELGVVTHVMPTACRRN